LAQELVWDGKDDLGKPATGGPFSVRVALGMRPEFDRLIGNNPGGLAYVQGLAVGPDGTLYVFNNFSDLHPADGTTVVQAYDRAGKYLRQVLPWPANTPEEKLKGLKRVEVAGKKVPYVYNAETRSLIPGLGHLPSQRAVVTRDGRLAFVGLHESGYKLTYNNRGPNRLTVVNVDGSVPEGGVLRGLIASSSTSGANLALSPDEKTIYAAKVAEGKKSLHAVLKVGWDDAKPEVFVGKSDAPGSGADGLKGPRDVAVDAEGNVYVADRGNNRVAVFKPDGSFLGELAVQSPSQVEVHPKTGAVYVLGGENCSKLSKYASWKAKAPAASCAVRTYDHRSGGYWMPMALDASAEPPVLWLGNSSNWAKGKLLRIEDKGTSFSDHVDVAKLPGNSLGHAGPRRRYNLYTAGAIYGMSLDRKNRKLFLNKRSYDLASGKWGKGMDVADGCKEGCGSFGLDGNYYAQVQVWKNIFVRYSPAGKPLPFPDSKQKSGGIAPKTSFRLRGRGITADPLGNIYSLQQTGPRKPGDAKDANNLAKYSPEGRLLNGELIGSQIRSLNSVRLDYRGNIWVGVGARPAGKKVPAHLEGQDLGKPYKVKVTNVTTDFNWYPFLYGCIAKFGPEGGEVRAGSGGVPMEFSTGGKTEIKGAKWIHFGGSPLPSWRLRYPNVCPCESPRFEVDGYGRCFFTDAACFRVGVLDTGGNLITWFGSYGNVDSAGPESAVPEPPIAFHWPYAVCTEDRAVYVGDRLNRRVTAVKLTYAAEETVKIP
ncbi:MAG: hypothetical protein ACYTGB_13840, partial [Planctomycetota bacterium]